MQAMTYAPDSNGACAIKIDIGNNQKGVLIYERDDDNNRSSKNAKNKSRHHQEMGGNGKGKKGKKGSERLEGL